MTQITARHRPRAITCIEHIKKRKRKKKVVKSKKLGKRRDHTTILGTNVTGGG